VKKREEMKEEGRKEKLKNGEEIERGEKRVEKEESQKERRE
jgi:hypothetical protein